MEHKMYVLKRTNGMMGIYVGGHGHEHLQSNFSQRERASDLFDSIRYVQEKHKRLTGTYCTVEFTVDEEAFKSGLLS